MFRTITCLAALSLISAAYAQSAPSAPTSKIAPAASGATSTGRPVAASETDAFVERINHRVAENFAKADQNHDGRVTPAEAKGNMRAVTENFDKIDKTHAGSVTLAQVEDFLASRRAERKAGHARNETPADSPTPAPATTGKH